MQILALYEVSPHESQTRERNDAAFRKLDSLILVLGLTSMDRGHPSVSSFVSHSAPVVMSQSDVAAAHYFTENHSSRGSEDMVPHDSHSRHHINFPQSSVNRPIYHDRFDVFEPLPQHFGYAPNESVQSGIRSDYSQGRDSLQDSSDIATESSNHSAPATRCTCADLSLAHNPLTIAGLSASAGAAQEARLAVGFTSSPAWNPDWSDAMIEREQSRTVVWSA